MIAALECLLFVSGEPVPLTELARALQSDEIAVEGALRDLQITLTERNSGLQLMRIAGGWQLSTIAQLQSGRPFNATVTGDPNNDGNLSTDRPPYVGRNTLTGKNFEQWDLRISRDFPLYRERVRLRLLGEAFNLTNRANFNAIQTNQYAFSGGRFIPTTNFQIPTSTFDPRILQLAAKIIF